MASFDEYLKFCIDNAGRMATGTTVVGHARGNKERASGRIVCCKQDGGVVLIGLEKLDGAQKKYINMPALNGQQYFKENDWFNVIIDRKVAISCLADSVVLSLDNPTQREAAPIREEVIEQALVPKASCGHRYCSSFCHLRYAGII